MSVASQSISPVLNIWAHPRDTIHNIVDTDPIRHVILLAAVGGVGYFLGDSLERSFGEYLPIPAIILLTLFIGPVEGIALLYIRSWIVSITIASNLFGATTLNTLIITTLPALLS